MTAEFNAGHNQLASCKLLGASKKFITPRENSQAPSQTKMILTNCAACAAPLAHDAPTRCVRCQTRYCSATKALYKDDGATADDLREAIQTLEDAEPIARRVLGGSHPLVASIEQSLLDSRAALGAREQPSDDEDA